MRSLGGTGRRAGRASLPELAVPGFAARSSIVDDRLAGCRQKAGSCNGLGGNRSRRLVIASRMRDPELCRRSGRIDVP